MMRAFMAAFILRLPSLKAVGERFKKSLGTKNSSSLSHALRRPAALRFVQSLVARLEPRHTPARDALVAVDTMPVTLQSTQRHNCARYNDKTVGGGALWTFAIDAARDSCPVRVLKIAKGHWSDTVEAADVALEPDGPVYLFDRGFYGLKLIEKWIDERVRFIVRARNDAVGRELRTLSKPRPYGSGWIDSDARVRLGSPGAQAHPEARMIRARVGDETIILVTTEMKWNAERILDAYAKRHQIEQFHRILKDTLGLSHLYSFAWEGIEFLLHTVLLLAMVLLMAEMRRLGRRATALALETINVLLNAVNAALEKTGHGTRWRRNTPLVKRSKRAREAKAKTLKRS